MSGQMLRTLEVPRTIRARMSGTIHTGRLDRYICWSEKSGDKGGSFGVWRVLLVLIGVGVT